MRVLAFDTATPATSVALSGLEPTTLELRDDPLPGERPRHATRLLPLITEVMERSDAGWDSIDRIAVGVGPGTFTGLRIGIATAKALGRAARIPLVGVSTLHALALNASPEHRAVAAVIDARRGEAFAAVLEAGRLALPPQALAPEALVRALSPFGPGLLAIGDGALAFREQLERAGFYVPDDASALHRVTAAAHCQLAPQEPVAQPDELHPDYQRQPDAQPRSVLSPASQRPHDR